jgi:N utilization substance protein B
VTTGPRHQAREAALQILYFWEVGGARPDDAVRAVFAEHLPEASDAVKAFAARIVQGTIEHLPATDRLIAEHAEHWRLERMAIIDRLILRMAVWELSHEPETPAAVVLDEAVELARTFGTDESTSFVNGVLDAVRRTLAGLGPRIR